MAVRLDHACVVHGFPCHVRVRVASTRILKKCYIVYIFAFNSLKFKQCITILPFKFIVGYIAANKQCVDSVYKSGH